MKTFLFLSLISFNLMAMVPKTVENETSLFVHQHTPVWCWAAMAESIYNYHNTNKIEQDVVAKNNPHSMNPEKMNTYAFTFNDEGRDYLLDTISSDKFIPYIYGFSNELAKKLIDKNHPVLLIQHNHVRVIFAYIPWGEQTTFLVFDPGSHLTGTPSVYPVESWSLENPFFGSLAGMLYLDKPFTIN